MNIKAKYEKGKFLVTGELKRFLNQIIKVETPNHQLSTEMHFPPDLSDVISLVQIGSYCPTKAHIGYFIA